MSLEIMEPSTRYTEEDVNEWIETTGIPFDSFWVEVFDGFETVSYKLEDGREFDMLIELPGLKTAICDYLKKHGQVKNI